MNLVRKWDVACLRRHNALCGVGKDQNSLFDRRRRTNRTNRTYPPPNLSNPDQLTPYTTVNTFLGRKHSRDHTTLHIGAHTTFISFFTVNGVHHVTFLTRRFLRLLPRSNLYSLVITSPQLGLCLPNLRLDRGPPPLQVWSVKTRLPLRYFLIDLGSMLNSPPFLFQHFCMRYTSI